MLNMVGIFPFPADAGPVRRSHLPAFLQTFCVVMSFGIIESVSFIICALRTVHGSLAHQAERFPVQAR